MKRFIYLTMAALLVLAAASCKKDGPGKSKYGVDGKTPMPEAIDLGLASGVKWASFNLGASKPEEYGDYYAWGETEPKSDFSWATYKYANGAPDKLTKYCPKNKSSYWDVAGKDPDGEVILLPSDDVAHVKLGGKWRMPTLDDINELLALKTNEDYTWDGWTLATDANGNEIKDARGNVVRGIRITRKSTGATLFLPAAGFFMETSTVMSAGSRGHYWPSSLKSDSPDLAIYLGLFSSDSEVLASSRSNGQSVRPVYAE